MVPAWVLFFLAKEIEGSQQGKLASMDIRIKRNAFGSQQNSFEAELPIACLGDPHFLAVFIRAPLITACAATVDILASLPTSMISHREKGIDGMPAGRKIQFFLFISKT